MRVLIPGSFNIVAPAFLLLTTLPNLNPLASPGDAINLRQALLYPKRIFAQMRVQIPSLRKRNCAAPASQDLAGWGFFPPPARIAIA